MNRCAFPAGVVFDFDGTLVDSEIFHLELYTQAAEKLGLELSAKEYDSGLRGRTDEAVFAFLGERSGQPGEAAALMAEKQRYFLRLLTTGNIPPIRGAVEFLRRLADRGLPLAVATSALRAEAEAGLKSLGILSYFQGVAAAESVAQGKPAPDLYLKAAEILKVPPAECLAFEDSVAGVRAASAAGMQVIAVGAGQARALVEAGARRVIADFQGCDLP